MLLGLMRKHAQSWLIKAIMLILAVVFVLYFGTMRKDTNDIKAATVNDVLITKKDYQKAYTNLEESFRARFRDMWNEDMVKTLGLKKMALENLIDEVLIDQEAEKLGLEVTKEDVRQAILGVDVFKTNGRFDNRSYQNFLNYQKISAKDFESSIKKDLIKDKLRQFVSTFSVVTDQEILDQYTYDNEKIKVRYVTWTPGAFKDAVTLDDEGMQAFFEKNSEQYRVPEKIKLVYTIIDPKSFEKDVHLSEDEIKDYYEFNIDRYEEPEQVHARHILFKLDKNATEAQTQAVLKKAQDVAKQAKEGKDFAELAKKYSEDTTKSKGGDLGYFPKGRMVKEFEDAAFNMAKGEISDPIRTPYGYHIIKVEDIKEAHYKPLEQVRDSIVKTITKNKSIEMAYKRGEDLVSQMPYDENLNQYAAEQDLAVQETNFLSRNDRIPGIGLDQKQFQSLFQLEDKEISNLIELRDKFYIFQTAEKQASYIPKMEEVKDAVQKDYRDHLAVQKAKAAAEKFLAELRQGKDFAELAKENKSKVEQTDFFNRKGSIPGMDQDPELIKALFKLNKDNSYPDQVLENRNKFLAFQWEGYQGIDQAAYEKEKEDLRKTLLKEKQARCYEDWIESLRARAEIERFINP